MYSEYIRPSLGPAGEASKQIRVEAHDIAGTSIAKGYKQSYAAAYDSKNCPRRMEVR